ncbi:hypothetical protein IU487_22090 [Nocardia puris]|uniref:hypothetical protein n=1 Tax=Nocardia puris TaxID=208602 RepID=UPI001893E300|nr:hypothetical protein [Nocardia puris]MBF6213710.1 hypothetical protein [Nocardia puris]
MTEPVPYSAEEREMHLRKIQALRTEVKNLRAQRDELRGKLFDKVRAEVAARVPMARRS